MMSKSSHSGKDESSKDEFASLTFEQALENVEQIIDRIEGGRIGLEESLGAYERGIRLINLCKSRLAAAQQRVTDLTGKLTYAQAEERSDKQGKVGQNVDQEPDDLVF